MAHCCRLQKALKDAAKDARQEEEQKDRGIRREAMLRNDGKLAFAAHDFSPHASDEISLQAGDAVLVLQVSVLVNRKEQVSLQACVATRI